MKKQVAICMALMAVASSAMAVQTNYFQIGDGDFFNLWNGWEQGVTTNAAVTPTEYSITVGVPDQYANSPISNLTFTVTYSETNNYNMYISDEYLAAYSGAVTSDPDGDQKRLNGDEVLRLKVSYSDPDDKLQGIRVASFSPRWNTQDYETTVFSAGGSNFSITDTENNVLQDYDATGLLQLSTDNVDSWYMEVSVDDTLGGGTNFTESALGGFRIEYIVDVDYIAPPPAPPESVTFEFWNLGELDKSGLGASMTRTNTTYTTEDILTVTTVDIIGQDGSSELATAPGNQMNIGTSGGLAVNSKNDIWKAVVSDPINWNPNEAWVFNFNTNVTLRQLTFGSFNRLGLEGAEMTLSSAAFDDIVITEETINLAGLDLYIPAGTNVMLQMTSSTNVTEMSVQLDEMIVRRAEAPLPPYDAWVADQGLTPGFNDAYDYDAEPDGMDNLLEYALGADPLSDDATVHLPGYAIAADGTTNHLNYVYRRRIDYADRGLTYTVGSGTDLVFSELTNATVEVSSGAIDVEFESVTNQISTDVESAQFMQLKVTVD